MHDHAKLQCGIHELLSYMLVFRFVYQCLTVIGCTMISNVLVCVSGKDIPRPSQDNINFSTWARLFVRGSILQPNSCKLFTLSLSLVFTR